LALQDHEFDAAVLGPGIFVVTRVNGASLAVALGLGIGFSIVNPTLGLQQLLMGTLFWGALVGFLVQIYRMALDGVRWPWNRR